jgi:hypothetical protein
MFPANVSRAIAIGPLGEVAIGSFPQSSKTRVQVELLAP